jgi:hypothetical protein
MAVMTAANITVAETFRIPLSTDAESTAQTG